MSTPPLNPALFHLDREHLWIMHCSEGPVPRASLRTVRAFMHKELRPWEVRWEEDFQGIPAALRAEAAALLGGRSEDISLSPSTSTGLSRWPRASPGGQATRCWRPWVSSHPTPGPGWP